MQNVRNAKSEIFEFCISEVLHKTSEIQFLVGRFLMNGYTIILLRNILIYSYYI